MKTEEMATATDSKLINYYVWGNAINNADSVEAEMDKRGIDCSILVGKIDDLMYQAELRIL